MLCSGEPPERATTRRFMMRPSQLDGKEKKSVRDDVVHAKASCGSTALLPAINEECPSNSWRCL